MSVQNHRKAAVYRLFGAAGDLLYIGSSYDPDKRCEAHRSTEWWPLVARRTDEWCTSRVKAYDAESAAIWIEQPKYNNAGTRTYVHPATGIPKGQTKQRLGYLAHTSRRDACRTQMEHAAYAAALAHPEDIPLDYIRRADRASTVLIEDMQGLEWPERRRSLEKGRQFEIRALHAEGASDEDVALIMGAIQARIGPLPYLTASERIGSRRGGDGKIMHVVHAEFQGRWWDCRFPALGLGAPVAYAFSEIEQASRISISKWTGIAFENVAIRIRAIGPPTE